MQMGVRIPTFRPTEAPKHEHQVMNQANNSETSVRLIHVRLAPWMARIEEEASSLTQTKHIYLWTLQIAHNSPLWFVLLGNSLPLILTHRATIRWWGFEEAGLNCCSLVCVRVLCFDLISEQSMAFWVCTQVVNFCAYFCVGRECRGVMIIKGEKVQLVQP